MAKNKKGFNPGKFTKVKMPIVSGSWLTNVGKSIGMASFDVISEIMPATTEIAANASEYMSDFRSHMQELRSQGQRLKETADKSFYTNLAKDSIANALKDLKTGNIYQRATIDDEDFSDLGMGDFSDSDWDVGDDSDFDASFTSEDGNTTVTTSHSTNDGDVDINNVKVKVDVGNNSRLVQAMQQQTDAINTQTKVAVDNTKLLNETNKAFNRNLFAEISKTGKAQIGYLGSMDSNLATIVSVSQTLATSASIANKYYDDSMSVFNSINQTLNEIKEASIATRGTNGQAVRDKYGANVLDDVFSSNGIINFSAYKELINKQVKEAAASSLILSQLLNIVTDKDTLKGTFTHPLSMITEGVIKKMIPEMVKSAAGEFDKMLQESMITGLYRVKGLSDDANPLLSFLGRTFGIGNALKTEVDKSNYNKGKTDWNGESHKTLNEVIPYYLRKITAAVEGSQEVVFDYEKGTWNKLSTIQKEYDDTEARALISQYSSHIDALTDIINNQLSFQDKDMAAKTVDEFKKLLTKWTNQNGTRAKVTGDSFRQFVMESLQGTENPDFTNVVGQVISGYLDALPRSEVTALFGRNMLDARADYSLRKKREEEGSLATNQRYMKTGLDSPDSNLKIDKDTGNVIGVKYKNSPFIERDQYGRSSLDYITNIYKLLLNGIIVYPSGTIGGRGRGKNPNSDAFKFIKESSDRLGVYEDGYAPKQPKKDNTRSDEDLERESNKGKLVIKSNNENTGIYEAIAAGTKSRISAKQEEDKKEDWFAKFTGIDPNKPISKLMANLTLFLRKPGELGKKLFDTADEFLFKMVFGDKNDGPGVFSRAMAHVKVGVKNIGLWINDKLLEPLHEKLFGDNGLFEQIKKSQMWSDLKAGFSAGMEKLLGKKDANGKRSGGALSSIANDISGIGHQIKEDLVGDNDYSVLHEVKQGAKNIGTSVLNAMGIDSSTIDNTKAKLGNRPITTILDTVHSRIKTGINNALNMFTGAVEVKDERKEFLNSVKNDLNREHVGAKLGAGALVGGAAAAFLGGKVGFISSLFLPGGFIGGALLGLGLAITKNSETVQKMLFGDIGDDGTRQGGLIHKEVIDAFNHNKTGLVLGGTAGMVAAIGLIPSFFIPGGPVGGALLGMGASMAFKSNAMQNFLFGDEEAGTTGIAGKFKNIFKNAEGITDKGRFLDAGIGAGIGLLGSMFIPGGPVLNMLMGGLAGFGLSSEAFQNFMFGKMNKDGKREGGVIHKAVDAITGFIKPAIERTQIKFMGFMEQNIIAPFVAGMRPILSLGSRILSTVTSAIGGMIKYTGNVIKDFLVGDKEKGTKGILSPLINVTSTIVKSVKTVALHIISAPFKLIGTIGKVIDLGGRLRNLLSPIIDQVIYPILDVTKNAIKTVVSGVMKGIKTLILAPFKMIGGLFKGVFKLGGILKDQFMQKTSVGKWIRDRNSTREQRRQSGKGFSGFMDRLNKASTYRGAWVYDENGNKYFDRYAKDMSNTPTRESVGSYWKRMWDASKAYEMYSLAYTGDKRNLKKFKNTFNSDLTEKALSAKKRLNKNDFFEMFGFDTSLWGTNSKVAAADKQKDIDRFADKLATQDMTANNLVVTNMMVKNTSENGISAKTIGDANALSGHIDRERAKLQELINSGASEDRIKVQEAKIANLEKRKGKLDDKAEEARKNLNNSGFTDKDIDSITKSINRNRRKVIRGTTESDINAGVQSEIPVPDNAKQKAFGGVIADTGAYWLSKGEKVISNARDKWKNFREERRLKEKYAKEGNFGDTNFVSEDGEVQDQYNGTTLNKSAMEQKAELAASQSRNAYNYEKIQEEKEKAKERAENNLFREKMLSMVEGIGERTAEHADSWLSIFGKKGLFTLAAIALFAAFPGLIKGLGSIIKSVGTDILEWGKTVFGDVKFGLESVGGIKGVANNIKEEIGDTKNLLNGQVGDYLLPSQTKVDIDGSVTGTKGAVYTDENTWDSKTDEKLGLIAKPFIESGINRSLKKTMIKEGIKSNPTIIGAAINAVRGTKQSTASKVITTAADTASYIAKKATQSDKSIIKKFIGFVDDALAFLKDRLIEFFTKHNISLPQKIVSLLAKFGKGVSENVLTNAGSKVINGIKKQLAKFAAATSTAFVADVVMFTGGAVIGCANAANMFQMDMKDVSFGTRTLLGAIAAFFKGILATSYGGFIDLANAIIFSITGTDLVTELALLMFQFLANDKQEEEVTKARDNFKDDYAKYVQEEYNAYVENAQANGEEYMDFESFKQSEYVTSFDEYNNEQHATLGKKVYDGVKNVGRTIKRGASTAWNGIKTAGSNIKTGTIAVGKTIGKKITDIGTSIGTTINDLGALKDFKLLSSDKITGFKDILKGGAYWKSTVNSDNKLVNVAEGALRVLGLPHAAVTALTAEVKTKVFDSIIDGFGSIGNITKEAFKTDNDMFKDGFNLKSVFKNYLTPSTKYPSGFAGGIASIIFFIGRVINLIPSVISSALNFAGDKLKGFFGLDSSSSTTSTNGSTGFFSNIINKIKSLGGKGTVLGGNGGSPEMRNGFPYFSQNDSSISNSPYKLSSGDITSYAQNMARLAEAGNYSTEVGTTPDYFTNVGSQLGMNVTQADATPNNVSGMLRSGQPVILQGQSNNPSSPFTPAGHYVVGVGMDGNGNVKVNDPNGRGTSRSYNINALTKDANLAFGYSNPGGYGIPLQSGKYAGSKLAKVARKMKLGGRGGASGSVEIVKAYCVNNACYKAGKSLNVKGLMLHSVGCPQPSAQTFVNQFNVNNPGGNRNVCVHAFVDANTGVVYQTLPWDMVGWHAGGSANGTHIGVELCEPDCIKYTGGSTFTCSDKSRAQSQLRTAYNAAVKLFAYLCKQFNLNPLANGVIISHAEGHKMGVASGHGDPDHLFSQLGMYSMDGFRRDVNDAMGGVNANIASDLTMGTTTSDSTASTSYSTVTGTSDTSTNTSSSGGPRSFASILSSLATAIINPIKSFLFGDDTNAASEGTTSSSVTTSYGGSTSSAYGAKQDVVYNKLKSLGYSTASAAGIMGNLQAESGFNPTVVGDNGAAYGLAQWHNYGKRSGRWLNMSNYAKSIGSNYDNLEAQTAFLDKELDPSSQYKDSIAANAIQSMFGGISGLKNSNDFKKVAEIIMTKYERPADQSSSAIAGRQAKAEAIYNYYKNGGGTTITGTNSTGSSNGNNTLRQYQGGLSGLTADDIRFSDIFTLPKVNEQQTKAILNKHFVPATWKGQRSIFANMDIDKAANGIYRAQNETNVTSLIPLAIGALESAYGASSIAHKKGNLWGWNATNSNPMGNASSFGASQYDAFKDYVGNKLVPTYYTNRGAKSLYMIGTGNNPSGKGYAWTGTQWSTTWDPNIANIGNNFKNTALSGGGNILNYSTQPVGGYGDFVFDTKPKGYRNVSSKGGYGHGGIDRTIYRHDQRAKAGYGSYDDTNVVNILTSMLSEMKGTNEGINKFNDKDFGGNGNTINYIDNKSNNVIATQKPTNHSSQKTSNFLKNDTYNVAKKIANGSIMI